MARIRTIKPDFFKNEDLSDLDPIYRLLFIGLWTQADREGKLEDRPKRLKIEIFPYDEFDMDTGLNLLHEKGFILRYSIDKNPNNESTVQIPYKHSAGNFIKILTFTKHQQPNVKEASSGIPDPVFYKVPYEHCADTVEASQEGKGREGNGEQEREGNGEVPPHQNFSPLGNTSIYKSMEAVEFVCLNESTVWQESMMKKFKIQDRENIKKWIVDFFETMRAGGLDKRDLVDARRHCFSWINVQLEREKEKSSGKKDKGKAEAILDLHTASTDYWDKVEQLEKQERQS